MPLEHALEPTTDWVKLQALLPDGWIDQAVLCGALKFGRKFTPETLLRTLLMYLCEDASMVTIAERARGSDVVDISDVALLKRMNKYGEWLRWICERLVNDAAPVLLSDRRLLAIDGSTISDPYSKTATWRLHYTFDIQSIVNRRSYWREVSFVHWLLCKVVNPYLSLFTTLKSWHQCIKGLSDSPRSKRKYQHVQRQTLFG